MIEYRCGECGRLLVEADPGISDMEAHCKSCGEVRRAEPMGEVMHRTYRCTNDGCSVVIHAERHTPDWTFCAACGTATLEVFEEVRASARSTARVASTDVYG